VLRIIHQNWFILALIGAVSLGLVANQSLAALAASASLRRTIVAGVLFAMALPVRLEELSQAIRQPSALVAAWIVNMLALPLLAAGLAWTLPADLGAGLIVAACVPGTIASAAVLARRAGGDELIPLLLMLITNLTCFLTAPLWLRWLLAAQVNIQAIEMGVDLSLTVLTPMLGAQVLRRVPVVRHGAMRYRTALAVGCQIGLLGMVLIGAIQMGQRLQLSPAESGSPKLPLLRLTIVTSVLHLAGIVLAWQLAASLRASRPQRIGAALGGSQKTLMIGLKLAIDCGVSILPMVIYHIGQLIIDSLLVDWWRRHRPAQSREPSGPEDHPV
jgi:sodium/bile acid cotransporter 7